MELVFLMGELSKAGLVEHKRKRFGTLNMPTFAKVKLELGSVA